MQDRGIQLYVPGVAGTINDVVATSKTSKSLVGGAHTNVVHPVVPRQTLVVHRGVSNLHLGQGFDFIWAQQPKLHMIDFVQGFVHGG